MGVLTCKLKYICIATNTFLCGLQEEISQYGIDWEGPSCAEDDNRVEVPETTGPLTDNNLLQLIQRIAPAVDDGNYGIELYSRTVAEVTHLVLEQRSTDS